LEQTTQDIFGPTSQAAFDFFDQSSVSLKTSKDTLPLDSEKLLENWKNLVTKRRGEYSARLKLARATSESVCLSWPTANARDWKDGSADCNQRAIEMGHQMTLGRAATQWSTPSTMMSAMYPESNANQRNSPSLASQVVMWPTPTTAEAGKISCCPNYGQLGLSNHPEVHGFNVTREKLEKSRHGHQDQVNLNINGSHLESLGKLNPRWVETLMGLPVGWTMPSCASPVTIAQTNCASSATE
jgi:hypothetical protein